MPDNVTSSHKQGEGLVHEALIYHGAPDLGEALEEFVRASAVCGEPILVALAPEKLDRLHDRLAATGAAARFADIVPLAGNPACLLPVISDWVDRHGGRSRVIAEPLWSGRSYPETVECLRHEALVNHALADAPASILCPFDADALDGETLAGAELTHPTVLEGGTRRPSDAYGDPIELLGSGRWPLEPPCEPVSAHAYTGSLRDLRHAVADDPLVDALPPERRADLVLAVNEATTNAVRHGGEQCAAAIWHDGRSVVSEITCPSPVLDPLAGRRRPEPGDLGGRGLWLINHLCDLVELRSDGDGTAVRMHMHTA